MAIKKKALRVFDDSFHRLARNVDRSLKANEDGSTQQEQVETLLRLEDEFRRTILSYAQSDNVYKDFLAHIIIDKGNILTAGPYFRDQKGVFTKHISPALKSGNYKALQRFSINYKTVVFIKSRWLGKFPEDAELLYQKIVRARQVLIENNMPLAINIAKKFYNATPKGKLSLMDMIDLCAAGLCVGVDKWSGPYSRVFLSVCIGRMKAHLMAEYNQTVFKFTPEQEKILYRLNKIRAYSGIEEVGELTSLVNDSLKEDADKKGEEFTPLTESEVVKLLKASSILSLDGIVNSDDPDSDSDSASSVQFNITDEEDIERNVIEKNALGHAYSSIDKMRTLEVKILKLKGWLQ